MYAVLDFKENFWLYMGQLPGGEGLLNINFGGGVRLVLQKPDPVLNQI